MFLGFFIATESEVVLLTEKQKRFADEYLIDLNATRAYKAAYPNVRKDTVAAVNASKLLRNTKVKSYIDEQLREISNARIANATEVMEYLTMVLRGESKAEVVVVEGCGDGYSEAKRFEKAPDEKERLKAAELLGKRYGIFTDKVKIEGNAVVQILDNIPGGNNDDKA